MVMQAVCACTSTFHQVPVTDGNALILKGGDESECSSNACVLSLCVRVRIGRATTQQGGTQEVGQGFNKLKQGVKEGAQKVRRLQHAVQLPLQQQGDRLAVGQCMFCCVLL